MIYIAKKIALSFPPLRRLYDFALTQSQAYSQARYQLQIAETKIAELTSEVVELKTSCEAQDLRLYVMRSDLQRAAVRNEELAKTLVELQDKYNQSQKIDALSEKIIARLDTAVELISFLHSRKDG